MTSKPHPQVDISLAALLAPMPVDEFLREHLGRAVLHLPGDPERFSTLYGWADVNDLLTLHRFDSSRVRLVRNSEVVPFPLFTEAVPRLNADSKARRVVVQMVARYLADGFSLVLNGVDESHEPLRTWTAALEQLVRVPVQTNTYISVGHEQGFRVHWDDHDVIVLQVSGSKRWELYGQTLPAPVSQLVDPPQPAQDAMPERVLVMQQGDFLHVPRGTWHGVASQGEPTVHLTIGFRRPTVADVLHHAVRELTRRNESLRVNAPLLATDDERSDWGAELAVLVTELVADPALLSRTISEDEVKPRISASLPEQLSHADGG